MNKRIVFTIGLWLASLLVIVPCALLLGYLGTVWLTHDFNSNFLRIDSCLDVGGSWNYEVEVCER